MADEKLVSYDFLLRYFTGIMSVDAPYGTDPDTLIGQALVKLIRRARHGELEIYCENIYDAETGTYEEVPDEWYKNPIERKKTYSEEMQDDLEPLED